MMDYFLNSLKQGNFCLNLQDANVFSNLNPPGNVIRHATDEPSFVKPLDINVSDDWCAPDLNPAY